MGWAVLSKVLESTSSEGKGKGRSRFQSRHVAERPYMKYPLILCLEKCA